MDYINFRDVIKKSSIVALASPKEIKRSLKDKLFWDNLGVNERTTYKESWLLDNQDKTFYAPTIKNPKSPALSLKQNPKNFTDYDDEIYGSGVLCNYIPEYELYLVVIDLNPPKNESDIPTNDLLKICEKYVKTYTVKTKNNGYHLYLLSRKKPEFLDPEFNINYYSNTKNSKVDYVISNYLYDIYHKDKLVFNIEEFYESNKSNINLNNLHFKKRKYETVNNSDIAVIESSDKVLSKILEDITQSGLYKPSNKKTLQLIQKNNEKKTDKKLIKFLKEVSLSEIGLVFNYLRIENFSKEKITKIINKAFEGNQNLIDTFINILNTTFSKTDEQLLSLKDLKKKFSKEDYSQLRSINFSPKLTKKQIDKDIKDIDTKIAYYLEGGYGITDKMVIESVEKEYELFFESENIKYYALEKNKSIKNIDALFIMNHWNQVFGFNQISKTQCGRALNFITRPITKEPYILEFTNGILKINIIDNTLEFQENILCRDFIPKISFPFKWNSKAKGGFIKKAIRDILSTDREGFHDNEKMFLKCVGHSCMGSVEKGVLTVIIGSSGSGKSTLLTMLKRFFTFSEVSIPEIIKNERFALHPLVDKDINIDDDLQSDIWKSIGKLNTLITGNGGSIEVKHESERINLTTYNTPKLWGGSNAVPPVVGSGFARRIIIIMADNIIPEKEDKKSFQMDLINGLYDDGLEWLVYNSITLYMDERSSPFVSQTHKEAMLREHRFRSDPLRSAVGYLFIECEGEYLEANIVRRELKRWFRLSRQRGDIFEEHKQPSMKQMRNAMDRGGYALERRNYYKDDKKRSSFTVYEDVMLNPKWEEEFRKYREEKEKQGLYKRGKNVLNPNEEIHKTIFENIQIKQIRTKPRLIESIAPYSDDREANWNIIKNELDYLEKQGHLDVEGIELYVTESFLEYYNDKLKLK